MSESNPLVERVDALLKRHQQQAAAAQAAKPADPPPAAAVPPDDGTGTLADPGTAPTIEADDDIPVLTEIVDPEALPGPDGRTRPAALDAATLEILLAELDPALQSRLNRAIGAEIERAMDGLRIDLSVQVRELVRDAIAEALRKGMPEHPGSS